MSPPLLSLPASYCFPRLSQEHGAVIQLMPLEHCAAELCLPGCNSPDSRKTSTPGGGSCTPRLPRQELCLQREHGVSKRWVNAPSASLTPLCSLSYLAEGRQGVEKLLCSSTQLAPCSTSNNILTSSQSSSR